MIKNDRQHTNRRYTFFRGLMAFGLVLGVSAFYSTANATAVGLVGQHSGGGNLAKAKPGESLDSDSLKLGFFDEEVLYLEFAGPGNTNTVGFDIDMFNVSINNPGITKIGLRFENINPSTAPTDIGGTFASFLEARFTFEGYPFSDTPSASEMTSVIGDDYIELWYTAQNASGDGLLSGGFVMNLAFDWDGLELADPTKPGFNLNIGINNPSLDLSTSPVPVPGAVWLFGTALTGLFLKRRKI